jgi:hypothetical protein
MLLHGDGSKPWYLVNIKIAGKWMFIPLKKVLIGFDPYTHDATCCYMLVLRIECQSHISSDLALKNSKQIRTAVVLPTITYHVLGQGEKLLHGMAQSDMLH